MFQIFLFKIIILLSLLLGWSNFSRANTDSWLKVDIGLIGIASEDIMKNALAEAEEQRMAGLILVIDTPGGSLDATRSMVKVMLSSNLPIVTWVGPAGARAGSAGSFITLAGHIASMAPSTQIGAAHPVNADGSDVEEGHMATKIENDTVAFMESIAKQRNRNSELARSFVLNSTSVTAEEALSQKVIDLVSENVSDLMRSIDKKKVTVHGEKDITLSTANIEIVDYERSLQQNFLEIIGNPNLFYLFFLAGLIGIGFELTHPGSLFPGIAGGICLILALIAMSVLPINFGALVLLLVGVACMIAEMFLPSFGIVGIGGLVAFSIGSFLLVDPHNREGLRISLSVIVPAALTVVLVLVGISFLVLRTARLKKFTGSDAMIGKTAEVIRDFQGNKGRVRVEGEDWAAAFAEEVTNLPVRGETLVITGIKDLVLYVKKNS